MKLVLAILLLVAAHGAWADTSTLVKGVIGDTDLSYMAHLIKSGESVNMPVRAGSTLLRVREIYPDEPEQPRYVYDILIDGRLIFRRDYKGAGFGPVSYFVKLPAWAKNKKALLIRNRGTEPVRINEIIPVDKESLTRLQENDSFGLLGLVIPYHGPEEAKKWLLEIAEKMPVKEGFYRGFSSEIPYAAHPAEKVAEAIERQMQWAKQYDLAFLPSFVSWWGGTPLRVPDGEGGKFGDIKYQQVCWSPENNNDDPNLKALLGDRWDPHYVLSIPNHWASTPWLTMNSPTLNAYRQKRLGEAVELLTDRMSKLTPDIPGIYLENEPRYWDTACEAGNPKREQKLETVWADFNPLVIEDAARDGVTLNPADGLDRKERLWLVRNVTRYNQKAVDWTREGLKKSGLAQIPDVYTHSLQLAGFPGDEISHPMSEFAYSPDACTGLEGLWTKLSDFDRVREWGPWANVNREENDGQDIKYHLWDLRVTYARGGKLYNSYNWHNIGSQRFFDYVKEFLDNLPSTDVKNPEVKQQGLRSISFKTDPDTQGANKAGLKVDISAPLPCALLVTVKDSKGRIIGFSRAEGPFATGSQKVEITFADPFELPRGERGTLQIEVEKPDMNKHLTLQDASFSFDLRRERNQSLLISKRK